LTGWVSERDRGYADAIRKGFAKGSGKYQCWINSGDLLLNGALDLARTILDDSGADMIFGDDFYIDDNDNIIRYSRAICHDLKNHMLYGDWTPLQDACFWRTEIYQRAGGIDPTLLNAADFSLFAKISTIGDIKYAPFAFSAFRRHDQQKSILHHSDYKIEKEMVRKSLLLDLQHSAIKKTFLRIIYFLIVRWKIRVLQHIWNLPELHGISINKIDAGSYAPHALMK
jgi:hypothetical protein